MRKFVLFMNGFLLSIISYAGENSVQNTNQPSSKDSVSGTNTNVRPPNFGQDLQKVNVQPNVNAPAGIIHTPPPPTISKEAPHDLLEFNKIIERDKPKNAKEARVQQLNFELRTLEYESAACIREVDNMKKRNVSQSEIDSSFWGKCFQQYSQRKMAIDKELGGLK